MARMGAQEAMLHAANTLPFLSPQHSLALEDGTGIVMAGGGPVESFPVPYGKIPALKGKSLPPIMLLPQAGMGMGAKNARNGVGFDINCDLDRNSAWLDGDGGDIAAGEWLMRKHNWMVGPDIAIPGLTFSFD